MAVWVTYAVNVLMITGLYKYLIIRDRKLDIVTKDAVPVEEFTLTFDAQGEATKNIGRSVSDGMVH